MEPATIAAAAGASLLGSLISWYQGEQAQEATESERARIKALIDNLQDPNYDISQIQPEELILIDSYVPEATKVIEDAAPQVIQRTQDMLAGRDAQMQSLRQMQQLAAQGQDPIAEMDRLAGSRQAAIEANIQRQNLQAGMARRGIGDSGLSLGQQQIAAGQAGYNTAMAGEQAARDALSRRASAAGQAASIGGQVVGQDTDLEARNVGIINAFNERMGQRRQQVESLNTGVRNAAGATDVDRQQDLENRKITLRQGNKDRANNLETQKFNNAANKIALQTGASNGAIQSINQGAANNQALATGMGQVLGSAALGLGKKVKVDEDVEDMTAPGY